MHWASPEYMGEGGVREDAGSPRDTPIGTTSKPVRFYGESLDVESVAEIGLRERVGGRYEIVATIVGTDQSHVVDEGLLENHEFKKGKAQRILARLESGDLQVRLMAPGMASLEERTE